MGNVEAETVASINRILCYVLQLLEQENLNLAQEEAWVELRWVTYTTTTMTL